MQAALFSPAEGPVAGVDEAGRGPLAGPVVAGAVILDPHHDIPGLADSKTLSESAREALADSIARYSIAWSVGWADSHEIDRLNILQATFLAMRRAIIGLRVTPTRVEVDGNRLPNLMFDGRQVEGTAIVGGDGLVSSISAASIIAKVHRDRIMCSFDKLYPGYGFSRHKGYGTEAHREALSRFGPCPQHRRTFRPISSL